MRKCNNCGKFFSSLEFSDEHCPYCGQFLSKSERENVRKKEYFWKKLIPNIYAIFFLFAIISAIIYLLVKLISK